MIWSTRAAIENINRHVKNYAILGGIYRDKFIILLRLPKLYMWFALWVISIWLNILFVNIHVQLLNKRTKTEHQIASRIKKTIDPSNKNTVNDPLIQLRLRQKWAWISKLIIYYKHDARLEHYKKRYSSIMESHIYRNMSDESQTDSCHSK
jgi:hypothetical protein